MSLTTKRSHSSAKRRIVQPKVCSSIGTAELVLHHEEAKQQEQLHRRVVSTFSVPISAVPVQMSPTSGSLRRMPSSAVPGSRRRSIFDRVIAPTSAPLILTNDASVDDRFFDYEETGFTRSTEEDWLNLMRDNEPAKSGEDASGEIEQLLMEGIPKKLRGLVWAWLAKRELSLAKQTEFVPKITQMEFDKLVLTDISNQPVLLQQIQVDLPRTFPNHPYFQIPGESGQLSLFKLLKSYALVDPQVGYCQGINFVAGLLLLHTQNDYEAFKLLLYLMFGFGLRTIYLPTMNGLRRCLYQFTRLLDGFKPDLLELFIVNNTSPDMFVSPWIITLFASQFPLGFVARAFDLIFYGNTEMLFRLIYSLFAVNESEIVAKAGDSFDDFYCFVKNSIPLKSAEMLEKIIAKVFFVDFSVELDRFAVEYDIYSESKDEEFLLAVNRGMRKNDSQHSLGVVSIDSNNDHGNNGTAIVIDLTQDEPTAEDMVRALVEQLTGARLKVSELQEQVAQLQAIIAEKDGQIGRLRAANDALAVENQNLVQIMNNKKKAPAYSKFFNRKS